MDVILVVSYKEYYKGEGGDFPKFGPCGESYKFVYACGLIVHQKCSNYKLSNLLFGLCRFVWIIDPLVIRRSPHPETPPHPSTCEVLQTKERTPIPFSSNVFSFGFAFESSKECGGCINLSSVSSLCYVFQRFFWKYANILCLLNLMM